MRWLWRLCRPSPRNPSGNGRSFPPDAWWAREYVGHSGDLQLLRMDWHVRRDDLGGEPDAACDMHWIEAELRGRRL